MENIEARKEGKKGRKKKKMATIPVTTTLLRVIDEKSAEPVIKLSWPVVGALRGPTTIDRWSAFAEIGDFHAHKRSHRARAFYSLLVSRSHVRRHARSCNKCRCSHRKRVDTALALCVLVYLINRKCRGVSLA